MKLDKSSSVVVDVVIVGFVGEDEDEDEVVENLADVDVLQKNENKF